MIFIDLKNCPYLRSERSYILTNLKGADFINKGFHNSHNTGVFITNYRNDIGIVTKQYLQLRHKK